MQLDRQLVYRRLLLRGGSGEIVNRLLVCLGLGNHLRIVRLQIGDGLILDDLRICQGLGSLLGLQKISLKLGNVDIACRKSSKDEQNRRSNRDPLNSHRIITLKESLLPAALVPVERLMHSGSS